MIQLVLCTGKGNFSQREIIFVKASCLKNLSHHEYEEIILWTSARLLSKNLSSGKPLCDCPLDIYSLITAFLAVVGLVLTTMIYLRIYFTVKQHKKRIQIRQVQQMARAGEIVILSRLTKSAVAIFYVYLVFLLCYLPYLICLVAPKMNAPSIALKRFSLFSFTLLYLNSSLNPVIYCWKMRNIRRAVINILRNMSWNKSGASRETLALAGHTMPWFSVVVSFKHFLYTSTTADSFNLGCSRCGI